jgi:hypothetical protein
MAKAEKMNRGVSSKQQRGGGTEIKLPDGVHSIDSLGNVYASIPELSRVQPKYFTMDQLKTALEAGQLTTLNEDGIKELEATIARTK